MAYKESNPAVVHIVLFIIVISVLGFLHLLLVAIDLNLFMLLLDESVIAGMGLMMAGMGIYVILPKAYLFFLIVFAIAMYRRGVYGDKHEKATLAALLTAVLGTFGPIFLFIITFMFEKGYTVTPFIVAMPFTALAVALYLYIKDLGGKAQAKLGLIIYIVGLYMMATIVSVALFIGEDMDQDVGLVLSGVGLPWTVVSVVGLVFFMLAYVKAMSWVKAHKPQIDTQQSQQISMQKEQMVMQTEQLELQRQQIEMLQKTIEMLTQMRSDLIGSGAEQIPEKANIARKPPDGERLTQEFSAG